MVDRRIANSASDKEVSWPDKAAGHGIPGNEGMIERAAAVVGGRTIGFESPRRRKVATRVGAPCF